MIRPRKPLFTVLTLCVLCFVCARTASADPITITLDNPHQVGRPGQTVTYTVVITNNTTATFNFTGTGVSFAPTGLPGAIELFPPPQYPALAPGADTGRVTLYTFVIPADFDGPFSFISTGLFTVVGDGGLSTANFSLRLLPAEPVPEPATVLLLGAGLAGALGAVRSRRKTRASDAA